jgi:hypothetical protein
MASSRQRRLRGLLCVGLALGAGAARAQGGPPDADDDGVEDIVDVCSIVPDPLQADANGDGDGDLCECGDADGSGVLSVRDWATLARCTAFLGTCGPLCDVTADAVCDGADAPPLRGHLVSLVAKEDLRCAQRRLVSEIPEQAEEEEPPTHDLDPLPPGYSLDDPLLYGTDDLVQDPGPGPRRPAIGQTLANTGDRLAFRTAVPTASVANVVQPLDSAIVETPLGRWADVFLGPYLIRVLAAGAPPSFPPGGPTPELLLSAPSHALEDLVLTKTTEVSTDSGSGGQVFAVTGVALTEATSGAPLDQQGGLALEYPPTTCEEKAVAEFSKAGPLVPEMPPVHFPPVGSCSDAECVLALTGWISAHHNAWRAQQMLDYVAGQNAYYRSFIWGQPGLTQNGNPTTEESSPEYWFGHFADYRLDAIRSGIGKLRDMFDTLKTGGLAINLYCPTVAGNLCFTSAASAHHVVRSDVALCDPFFILEDPNGDPVTYWPRAQVSTHELMHHRTVEFTKDGNNLSRAVQDTHLHGHGDLCISDVSTVKFYGKGRVRELATYFNSEQGNCKHREKAFGNNDSWGYFVTRIGDLVHRKIMWTWPAPAAPTPQPPDCDEPGVEACQCAETLPFGEGSDPDGDAAIDEYCPDDETELSCINTKFNASSTVGVCVDCEEFRGPGCECDSGQLCDQGDCFGEDTFGGGGTGHCYVNPIPPWVCLADCERLFNDPAAYCYHEALGGARCYDSGCSEPEAESCFLQGKVCRDSACVIECVNQQGCTALGYPPAFECIENRCEFPL